MPKKVSPRKPAGKAKALTKAGSPQTESPKRPLTQVVAEFSDFLREQKVIGLAIAVVLGGAVSKLVAALVSDLINPFIGVLIGAAGDLASMSFKVGPVEILWGHFVATLIDFVIIAAVVYFLVKMLKLDKLDKKKE